MFSDARCIQIVVACARVGGRLQPAPRDSPGQPQFARPLESASNPSSSPHSIIVHNPARAGIGASVIQVRVTNGVKVRNGAAQTRCACFGATNANDQFVISASPQCIASGRSRARRAGRSDAVADRRAALPAVIGRISAHQTHACAQVDARQSFQRVSCAFAQLSRAFCLHFKDLVPRSAEGASRKDAALPFVSGARKLQKQRKRNNPSPSETFSHMPFSTLKGSTLAIDARPSAMPRRLSCPRASRHPVTDRTLDSRSCAGMTGCDATSITALAHQPPVRREDSRLRFPSE